VNEIRDLRRIVVVALVLLALPAAAQQLGQVAQEYRRSLESLRDYGWKSRIEVSVDGEVTSTRLYDVRVADNGALHRTLVGEQGKTQKQARKAEETLSGIRQLVDAYMHMKPEQIQRVFGGGARVFEADAEGLSRVRARDVFHQGDEVNLWVDVTDHKLHKAEIRTVMHLQPCRLAAEFDAVEGGPTFVARSVFEMEEFRKKKPTGKTMVVVTENFEHRRR
jgi:hypothetical protein